ncbi:MAG: hypothetical protein R3E31_25705 [Chloroflexota bacterium]
MHCINMNGRVPTTYTAHKSSTWDTAAPCWRNCVCRGVAVNHARHSSVWRAGCGMMALGRKKAACWPGWLGGGCGGRSF